MASFDELLDRLIEDCRIDPKVQTISVVNMDKASLRARLDELRAAHREQAISAAAAAWWAAEATRPLPWEAEEMARARAAEHVRKIISAKRVREMITAGRVRSAGDRIAYVVLRALGILL